MNWKAEDHLCCFLLILTLHKWLLSYCLVILLIGSAGHKQASLDGAFRAASSVPFELLSLFCLHLCPWHVCAERGEEGREQRGGGLPLRQRVHSTGPNTTEKELHQGRNPLHLRLLLSQCQHLFRVCLQPHRRSTMSLSGSQTPEDGLYGEVSCCKSLIYQLKPSKMIGLSSNVSF